MQLVLFAEENDNSITYLEELLKKEKYKVAVSEFPKFSVQVLYKKENLDEEALLRQVGLQLYEQIRQNVLQFDEIYIDLRTHEVTVAQQIVNLTKTEYVILKIFLQHPKEVLSKGSLLEKIGKDTPDCVENSLKVHVSNLRRKLKQVNGKDYLESIRGVGFRLID